MSLEGTVLSICFGYACGRIPAGSSLTFPIKPHMRCLVKQTDSVRQYNADDFFSIFVNENVF